MAPLIPELLAETAFDQEILTGDLLVTETLGPQPDVAALKRARKRFYRLITEVPSQHRLPAFKDESGQWACRRATVMAYRVARQAWLDMRERQALAAVGVAPADPRKREELTPDKHPALAALPEAARPLFLAFYRRKIGGEVAQKAA